MFFKLFWHDFLDDLKKKLSAFIVSCAALVLSIVAYPLAKESKDIYSQGATLVYFASIAAYVGMVLMLVSILIRFHRSFFTAEMHLTFTRPASRSAIILSKTLANALWLLVPTAVTTATTMIFMLTPTGSSDIMLGLVDTTLYDSIMDAPALFIPVLSASALLSALSKLSIAQFAITFGALIPKNSKLIAGIGIYFGSSLIVSTLTKVLSSALALSLGAEIVDNTISPPPESALPTYHFGSTIISIVVSLVVSIALFFITRLIINKKLTSAMQ